MRVKFRNENNILNARCVGALMAVSALLSGPEIAFANDNSGMAMTAGVIVNEMPVRERASYVMGVIDAMAYARFQRDTAAKGESDASGMDCITRWFHTDGVGRMQQIDAAFRKYADYPPSMVVAAMVGKECGK